MVRAREKTRDRTHTFRRVFPVDLSSFLPHSPLSPPSSPTHHTPLRCHVNLFDVAAGSQTRGGEGRQDETRRERGDERGVGAREGGETQRGEARRSEARRDAVRRGATQ